MVIYPHGHPQYDPQCMEICYCPVCDEDYLGIDINDTCPTCNYPEREPTMNEKATEKLIVRITPEQLAYLKELARFQNKSLSDFLRDHLAETLPAFPKAELKRGNPQPQKGIPKKAKPASNYETLTPPIQYKMVEWERVGSRHKCTIDGVLYEIIKTSHKGKLYSMNDYKFVGKPQWVLYRNDSMLMHDSDLKILKSLFAEWVIENILRPIAQQSKAVQS